MTGRISVLPKTSLTSKMPVGFELEGGGGGFSTMTYISPKPVEMQGLRTWVMSNNIAASRNGTWRIQSALIYQGHGKRQQKGQLKSVFSLFGSNVTTLIPFLDFLWHLGDVYQL